MSLEVLQLIKCILLFLSIVLVAVAIFFIAYGSQKK